MKVKEVLKGDLDLFDLFIFNSYSDWFGTISFGEFDMKHNYDNHFNDHNDKVFWDKNIGRSPFPCCVCAPLHKFSNEKESPPGNPVYPQPTRLRTKSAWG